MLMFDRSCRGFSLLELLIIIVLIGVLVGGALPLVLGVTDDARIAKAKADCDMLAEAIRRATQKNGRDVTELIELKGAEVSKIEELRDPWENPYEMDTVLGIVFSRGPDRKCTLPDAYSPTDPRNKDNVWVTYLPQLALERASLEVNPAGVPAPEERYDMLHLYFNKAVDVAARIDLRSASLTPTDDAQVRGETSDGAGGPGGAVFRFFPGPAAAKPVSSPFGTNATAEIDALKLMNGSLPRLSNWHDVYTDTSSPCGHLRTNRVYQGASDREIIIVTGPGGSGQLVPGTHFVNLTGTRRTGSDNSNKAFREKGGAVGAKMSARPIPITPHGP